MHRPSYFPHTRGCGPGRIPPAPKKLKAIDIKTMPYPGFPTDMQSIFATTLTTAKGTSIIVENIFENRYKYTRRIN